MILKDVARFAEVAARASDRTQGDEGTRKAARGIMEQMEQEHPGIAAAAKRAEQAMLDPFATPLASPSGPTFRDVLAGIGINAAAKFANGFRAELLDETRRQEPLARNEVTVKRHAAAEGQVCVEVRFRARDWSGARRAILRRVENEFDDVADEV